MHEITLQVANRQRTLPIDRSRLQSVARYVLGVQGCAAANLQISLVDDETMRQLNLRFLGKNCPTDVLTFPLHEPGDPITAEIVISAETAVREGPRHGLGPQNELLLYLIHGILHLCGYDDHDTRSARRMRARQRQLLQSVRTQSQIVSRKGAKTQRRSR